MAGSTGIGAGVAGACEMADASKSMKEAQKRDERNLQRLKKMKAKPLAQWTDLGNRNWKRYLGSKSFLICLKG